MLSRFCTSKGISKFNVRFLCSVVSDVASIPVINVVNLKPEQKKQKKSKAVAINAKPKPNQNRIENPPQTEDILNEKSDQETKKQIPKKLKKIKVVSPKSSDEFSSEDQNPKKAQQSTYIKKPYKPIIDQNLLYITGFSKFTSRRDLQLVLGEHKPCVIDPILNHSHQLFGAYSLKFSTTEESNNFRKFAAKSFRNKTPLGMTYKVKGPLWLAENLHLVRASSARITNKTLRVESTQRNMHSQHLLNLLEDYGICKNDINTRFYYEGKYVLVTFPTPEDAERAQVELDRSEFQHYQLKITSYDC